MSFCVFFDRILQILFNLTRLILWMICVCNMMKLFDVRLEESLGHRRAIPK